MFLYNSQYSNLDHFIYIQDIQEPYKEYIFRMEQQLSQLDKYNFHFLI